MKTKGTPKTLKEAIDNGLYEILDTDDALSAEVLEKHVIDFFNQKMGVFIMQASSKEKECYKKLKPYLNEFLKHFKGKAQ